MNFANAFTPERLQEAWECLLNEFPFAVWETVYSTLLATLFAVIIGLPLGVLLVTGEKKGIRLAQVSSVMAQRSGLNTWKVWVK